MFKFGPFLREKRKAKGLSQEKLARLLKNKGVFLDHTIISRWETGDRLPSAKQRETLLAIAAVLSMNDSEKNDLLVKAGLAPLQPNEVDVDSILKSLGPKRWQQSYFLYKKMGWDEKQIGGKLGIPFWDVRNDIEKAKLLESKECPENSLMISVQEVGGTAVDIETQRSGKLIAFTLGNRSENVITVNRICLEVLSCKPFDLPPPIEARFMPLKYEVTIRPDYLGEYVITEDRFRYAGPDADDFEVVCKSPAGFKYSARLNIYASDLATGNKLTVHSPTFEISFYKQATGLDILRKYVSH